MNWNIGNISINNKIVLAPMAGISNASYMKILEDMGVDLAFTELISAEAIVRNNQKTFDMLKGLDKLKMHVGVQLFGSNPDVLAKSAKILVNNYHVKLIDINMGCPVTKVAIKAKAGSALLKEPSLVGEIVNKVVKAVDVPVTVKIRSGWDDNSINAVEIAKICEANGAKAITVHARTRSQGYAGLADWAVIKEVKENVSIPVIGNGDVTSPNKALDMLNFTKCEAVMIGRAALGNPWLFKNCIYYLANNKLLPEPTIKEKIAMIKKHYNLLKEYKNAKLALLEIRSIALYYLKGLPDTKLLKEKIVQIKKEDELFSLLDDYINTI